MSVVSSNLRLAESACLVKGHCAYKDLWDLETVRPWSFLDLTAPIRQTTNVQAAILR